MKGTDWLMLAGILGCLSVMPLCMAIYGIQTGREGMASSWLVISMFWIMIVSCSILVYAQIEKEEKDYLIEYEKLEG